MKEMQILSAKLVGWVDEWNATFEVNSDETGLVGTYVADATYGVAEAKKYALAEARLDIL